MKPFDVFWLVVLVVALWAIYVYGQGFEDEYIGLGYTFEQQPYWFGTDQQRLGTLQPDAYGPGVWSDGTGRPFTWQPYGQ